MSADRMPIVRTLDEAKRHHPDLRALIELDGHLVRPIVYFRDEAANHTRTGESEMARAIELLLLGLADRESSMIDLGMSQAIIAAAMLTSDPEDVLEQVIAEENTKQDPNPTGFTVIRGGLEPLPMGDDADWDDDQDNEPNDGSDDVD